MDNTDLWLGVAMVIFGLVTLALRVVRPASFGKLEAMKERFGNTPGTIIHVVAYTAVPIVGGIVLVMGSVA